jgi:hypothetical protein
MLPSSAAANVNGGEPSTSAYSHISRASATKAIQYLDSYAFPDTLSTFNNVVAPVKRRKVADVDTDASTIPRSRFSNLAGLSHVHRERARQRRSERLAAVQHYGKREEQQVKSNTYQPFSLPLLLERLSTFSVSTYSTKPDSCKRLGPVALAGQGWKHSIGRERDFISCVTCQAEWRAAIANDISPKEREAAWKGADEAVGSKHLHWCPWRLRGCHGKFNESDTSF